MNSTEKPHSSRVPASQLRVPPRRVSPELSPPKPSVATLRVRARASAGVGADSPLSPSKDSAETNQRPTPTPNLPILKRVIDDQRLTMNKNELADMAICALIGDGFSHEKELISAMVWLGFNNKHAAIRLKGTKQASNPDTPWRRTPAGLYVLDAV